MPSQPDAPPHRRSATALLRFGSPIALLVLMWLIQTADALLPVSFTGLGLRSWDVSGLPGLVIGPLLHSGWPHLIGNSVPFLVLGCLVAGDGTARFWAVTGSAALIGGVGTWIFNAPGTVTVGASVLVFGYFGYLVARVFAPGGLGRRVLTAVVAAVVVIAYGGSMLAGIFRASEGVSWQAHLFGAVGGAIAALLTARRARAARLPVSRHPDRPA